MHVICKIPHEAKSSKRITASTNRPQAHVLTLKSLTCNISSKNPQCFLVYQLACSCRTHNVYLINRSFYAFQFDLVRPLLNGSTSKSSGRPKADERRYTCIAANINLCR